MSRVRLWWAAPTAAALVGGMVIGVVFTSDLAGGASVPDRITLPVSASPPATPPPRVVVPTVVAPSRHVETEGPDDVRQNGGGDGSGDH